MTKSSRHISLLVVLALTLFGSASCDDPPSLPEAEELERSLDANIEAVQSSANEAAKVAKEKNEDAKERLVPDAG